MAGARSFEHAAATRVAGTVDRRLAPFGMGGHHLNDFFRLADMNGVEANATAFTPTP